MFLSIKETLNKTKHDCHGKHYACVFSVRKMRFSTENNVPMQTSKKQGFSIQHMGEHNETVLLISSIEYPHATIIIFQLVL